jgi:integrase
MLLNSIFAWARHPERGYLNHNPLDGLPKLRLSRAQKREHLEPNQIEALLTLAAQQPPDDTIIRVVALSGLRRGELFVLKWEDLVEMVTTYLEGALPSQRRDRFEAHRQACSACQAGATVFGTTSTTCRPSNSSRNCLPARDSSRSARGRAVVGRESALTNSWVKSG